MLAIVKIAYPFPFTLYFAHHEGLIVLETVSQIQPLLPQVASVGLSITLTRKVTRTVHEEFPECFVIQTDVLRLQ